MAKDFEPDAQVIWMDAKANEIAAYLRAEGATKRAHNEVAGRDYTPVVQDVLRDTMGIAREMMLPISLRAFSLGIPLCVGSMGWYLSEVKGEIATHAVIRTRMIQGLAQSLKELLMTYGKTKTMKDAQEFAMIYLECDLSTLPARLRILGAPLAPEVEMLLLE